VTIDVKEKQVKPVKSGGQIQMPNRLKNNYLICDSSEEKIPLLINFIRKHKPAKFIIFMSTCAQVNFFEKILTRFLCQNTSTGQQKLLLLKLHRKLKSKRQKIFDQFRE